MSLSETYVTTHAVELDGRRQIARRSELEIKMDVLRVVADGIEKPTQVMYKANLSWIALQTNVKALLTTGFLREEELGSRKRYEVTPRGIELLQNYQKVVDTMNALPQPKNQVRF